jgi:hypothetical protein
LLQALDWAKKCDGKKCLGRKISRRAKTRFTLSHFFAHPFFCPSLKSECQLKGELNPERLLEGRVVRFFLSPQEKLKPLFVRNFPPWTAAACCRFGSGSLLPNEEFVNSAISERFSAAGLWFGKLQRAAAFQKNVNRQRTL